MFQAKVTARTVTPIQGKLLYTLTTTDGKVVNASFSKDQVEMLKLMDTKLPTIGQDVMCEFNVNPGTGLVSEQWVTLSI